jgi:hypothetical protein
VFQSQTRSQSPGDGECLVKLEKRPQLVVCEAKETL